MEFSTQFTERWSKDIPSAVKCLQNSMGSCLTFLRFSRRKNGFPSYHNVIERLNKEFKRRTKPMEIIAGGKCLLYPVSFLSASRWKCTGGRNPVGKVHYNLPSLRNLIEGNFTQSLDIYRFHCCTYEYAGIRNIAHAPLFLLLAS